MHASNFVLEDYLNRIDYHGPRDASAATLARSFALIPFARPWVMPSACAASTPV